MDWTKVAFVFPGQGSQTVGMAKDLTDAYPIVRQTFEQADSILGFGLTDLCFNGPDDMLNDTINTQPALYVAGIAILRALQNEIPEAVPTFVAGHSLGEFTALAAAGAVSFEDGLRLVRERGRLMQAAGTQSPGAMAAVLGLDAPQVREICAQASQQTHGQAAPTGKRDEYSKRNGNAHEHRKVAVDLAGQIFADQAERESPEDGYGEKVRHGIPCN